MTSKRAFLAAIRDLDADAVGRALDDRPELARTAESDGLTPLHQCARVLADATAPGTSAVAIARRLLDAGAEVDAVRVIPQDRRDFRATPLWYAVNQGRNPGVIALLLERGADPNVALWSACFEQELPTLDALLAYGVDLDADQEAAPVLIRAVATRKAESVRWLLAHGADPQAADAVGRTALHHGVERKVPMAELEPLLEAGARPDRPDREGKTPIDLAEELGRTGTVRFLRGWLSD